MKIFSLLILLVLTIPLKSQYSDYGQLSTRIKKLGQNSTVAVSSLTKTFSGKEIFTVTVGKGEKENKPGIAVIGGINGASLASVELIMQMAEKLAVSNSLLLDEVTFYFIPNVSPDATEQYFAPVRYERTRNTFPYDEDKDGKTDEDGFDDLNKDGVISVMRVLDPDKGEYFVHPDNPDLMVKADITKGEKGQYLVLLEGTDNDKDGKINEDQPGGVNFNRNFTFNYPYFSEDAGINAISEPETRSVAKFLFDHWNIFAVLCIGKENNLSEFSDLAAELSDKKITAVVSDKDKPYYQQAVEAYKKLVHLGDSSKVTSKGGDILSWTYFHYGRFGFGTPGWNVVRDKNNRGSVDFDYLKYAASKGIMQQVVPWQKFDHPDFPGKTVEIGGIKPFVALNPPMKVIDSISGPHYEFMLQLARMHPSLKFSSVKVLRNSGDLYQVEAEITNTGSLPTMAYPAVHSKWVKMVRLDILTSKSQVISGGKKVFLFDRIDPGESQKVIWLVNGKGKVVLKAGSPQTGIVARDVELN
ncbi:MAG TPA: M14 family metallopeptidase [Bacteroidales bacterium]|nr:M14 family metallopeptidase [Bacteroidales bacterium]